MRPPDLDERELLLADGVQLDYRAWGSGRHVLIAGGLCMGLAPWQPLASRLASDYRFVHWDYRGLTDGRGAPADPVQHARDALSILRHEGIREVAVIGWSIGVQVALELCAAAGDLVKALVLIGGGARAPWGHRHEATFPGTQVPRGLRLLHRVPRRALALTWRFMHSPEAHAWARRLGIVGEQVSADAFNALVRELDSISLSAYLQTLALAADHDAGRHLPTLHVPTLAVAAGRDPFTSRAAVERLVVGIAGAEYQVLPAATHLAPLDHADHLALRIQKFFSERGYGARPAAAG